MLMENGFSLSGGRGKPGGEKSGFWARKRSDAPTGGLPKRSAANEGLLPGGETTALGAVVAVVVGPAAALERLDDKLVVVGAPAILVDEVDALVADGVVALEAVAASVVVVDDDDADADPLASAFCFFWWLYISQAMRTCIAFHLPVF